MLTRRKSSLPSDGKSDGIKKKRGESVVALTEIINLESSAIHKKPSEILHNDILKEAVRLACLLSMISVCLHTPETIRVWPPLNYVIFINDCIITLIFLVEAAINIHHNGLWENDSSYLRDKWSQFDLFLLIMHVLSCALHAFELFTLFFPSLGLVINYEFSITHGSVPFDHLGHSSCLFNKLVGFAVCDKQATWISLLRVCLRRSSQQIQNVTIFFMFFMALYAIMGVQLFGRMDYHCVLNGTDPQNVTIADLAIPDTMCSQKGEGYNLTININFSLKQNYLGGYECPDNMVCMKLDMSAHVEGFYGMFNDFASSLFTVYMAASQEGWVYVLYDCLDTLPSYVAFFYFVTLIFSWLGSTLNLIRPLYTMNIFTYFQVFRIVRLIKASPMLEDFVYKIFGPGKKLGGLVIFTMVLLFITSAISLQLFCYVPNLKKFTTFPMAFMSMFQIITQEGWTDVVVEILRATNESMVPFVAIYFVGYHLLVTLIVLSLFVAVILDNLEMDEELKKVKQLKAREQNTIKTTLPWRLRVFDRFPTRPQMISLKKNLFQLIHQEIGRFFDEERASELSEDESNRNRALYSDSNQYIANLGRVGTKNSKSTTMRTRSRGLASLKGKNQLVEGLKENGDLRPSDSAPKNEPKHGEIDIKALQQKRAHAEITRNRIEEEMRENHPMFDRPLFAVGRDSRLRRLCQNIVHSQYNPERIDSVTGKQTQLKYKQLHDFIGLMTYLDWTMILVTSLSCWSMLFESPWPTSGENLIFNNFYLQITEYLFVLAMTFELTVKVIANGLFFTPKAVVKDVGDIMTFFIYFGYETTENIYSSTTHQKSGCGVVQGLQRDIISKFNYT
uniref:Ion_trans domain-containing protein n=1 Tax=Heterorhabditis bacteriophora TaxID=37862 RepID=A0A1I7XSL6_HETBA